MDPVSLTTGILALLGAAFTTGNAIKSFYDDAAIANTKVQGLVAELESFTQVLQLMNDTFRDESIRSSILSTGHIGNHWKNLSISIRDGQTTLYRLQQTIEKVNKSVSVFDGARKHLRLQSAADEIALYQQQIRSYRDTLQLSMQTVLLWNQVTSRTVTESLLPNLNDVQHEVRRIASDLSVQIASLQDAVESSTRDHELRHLNNLRNCVRSAASVASSASTTLGVEPPRVSVILDSEFGDIFPPEPGETMLRWISSNTVYEFEDGRETETLRSETKSPSSHSIHPVEQESETDQSDSDDELEAEIIESLMRRGKENKSLNNLAAAERNFRNCLTRISLSGPITSQHHILDLKSEALSLLGGIYYRQEDWDKAHSLMIEMIAFESRNTHSTRPKDWVHLDTLILVEILVKKQAFAEALLYGRRALKGYRKLGLEGVAGVENSLRMLCKVCEASGNHNEEDAYAAMLANHLRQHPPSQVSNETMPPTILPRLDAESSIPPPTPLENSPDQENVVEVPPASGNIVQESDARSPSPLPEASTQLSIQIEDNPATSLALFSSTNSSSSSSSESSLHTTTTSITTMSPGSVQETSPQSTDVLPYPSSYYERGKAPKVASQEIINPNSVLIQLKTPDEVSSKDKSTRITSRKSIHISSFILDSLSLSAIDESKIKISNTSSIPEISSVHYPGPLSFFYPYPRPDIQRCPAFARKTDLREFEPSTPQTPIYVSDLNLSEWLGYHPEFSSLVAKGGPQVEFPQNTEHPSGKLPLVHLSANDLNEMAIYEVPGNYVQKDFEERIRLHYYSGTLHLMSWDGKPTFSLVNEIIRNDVATKLVLRSVTVGSYRRMREEILKDSERPKRERVYSFSEDEVETIVQEVVEKARLHQVEVLKVNPFSETELHSQVEEVCGRAQMLGTEEERNRMLWTFSRPAGGPEAGTSGKVFENNVRL